MNTDRKDLEKLPLLFIKLKNGDDIVGYVVHRDESSIKLKRPLVVWVDNDMDSGRQYLQVREWIPPIVVTSDETDISLSDIMLTMDVLERFHKEYGDVAEYFYDVTPVPLPEHKSRWKKPKSGGGKVVRLCDLVKEDDPKTH